MSSTSENKTKLYNAISGLYLSVSSSWDKIKSISGNLDDYQIKSFANSDSISGNINANGELTLNVNISNFVANDITNALKIRTNSEGNPGLYVGLPIASNTAYGLVKINQTNYFSITNGILSVNDDAIVSKLSIVEQSEPNEGCVASYQLMNGRTPLNGVIDIPTTITTQVVKVDDILTFDLSTLTNDALLFTEFGETAIYDHERGLIQDVSEETVDFITEETSCDLIPNVGALTGYLSESLEEFDNELASLNTQFAELKLKLGIN